MTLLSENLLRQSWNGVLRAAGVGGGHEASYGKERRPLEASCHRGDDCTRPITGDEGII